MTLRGQVKLFALDEQISRSLRVAEKPGGLRTLAVILAHSGDSWLCMICLGMWWWLGKGEWKSIALAMLEGLILTACVVFILKLVVRRKRPEGEWGAIYRKTDPHSFPSGHAARAVMLAVIGLGLSPLWLGLALLGWACLVALARVAMGVHYFSDIFVGELVGVVTGFVTIVWLARF